MFTLLLVLACQTESPPPVAEPAPPAEKQLPDRAAAEALALAKGTDAIGALGKKLKGRLGEALAAAGDDGDASGAVQACAEDAQGITALAGAETRSRVGRSSLQLRNPNNGGPDWVQGWLTQAGDNAAAAGISEIHGDTARVLKPIIVEPVCLACHGHPEHMAPAVKSAISERYPSDKATGYDAGDLRGAIWAEVPIGS